VPVTVEEPGEDWEIGELTERQKTIRNFAYTVFALIALVTLVIVGDWLWHRPAVPTFASNVSDDLQKVALENFKSMNAVFMERAKDMFDLIIVKGLLPVFATIVGVLIGRRTDGGS